MSALRRPSQYLVGIPLALLLCVTSNARTSFQQQEGKKEEPPPIYCGGVMCSGVTADKTDLVLGETTDLRANASEPTGLELSYVWKASGGAIVGEGATVTYFAPTDKPGRYVVTVFVTDSRGHKVDCSTEITVAEKRNPGSTNSNGVQQARATERAQRRLTGSSTVVARAR